MNTEKLLSLFLHFVQEVQTKFCDQGKDEYTTAIDYDPEDPQNKERVFLDGWNGVAPKWAAIESLTTYMLTMQSFIEKIPELLVRSSSDLRILSLGTGPGLYEMFLASWLKRKVRNLRIFSLDYSSGMIEFQQKVLNSNLKVFGFRPASVKDIVLPIHGNMTDLRRFHEQIDIIICNNSLQWVSDWKRAIEEMALSINPKRVKTLFLVVHPHRMGVRTNVGYIARESVEADDLLDELEKQKFSPTSSRILKGVAGTGQRGQELNRRMFTLKYCPDGVTKPWRSLGVTDTKIIGFRKNDLTHQQ